MRISGSGSPQGIEGDGPAKSPRPGAAAGTENYPTGDLLAISAAAAAVSSSAERVSQLGLQVDSGEYFQSSAGIAQRLVTSALSRNY
jgi:hypothetical protein